MSENAERYLVSPSKKLLKCPWCSHACSQRRTCHLPQSPWMSVTVSVFRYQNLRLSQASPDEYANSPSIPLKVCPHDCLDIRISVTTFHDLPISINACLSLSQFPCLYLFLLRDCASFQRSACWRALSAWVSVWMAVSLACLFGFFFCSFYVSFDVLAQVHPLIQTYLFLSPYNFPTVFIQSFLSHTLF